MRQNSIVYGHGFTISTCIPSVFRDVKFFSTHNGLTPSREHRIESPLTLSRISLSVRTADLLTCPLTELYHDDVNEVVK